MVGIFILTPARFLLIENVARGQRHAAQRFTAAAVDYRHGVVT